MNDFAGGRMEPFPSRETLESDEEFLMVAFAESGIEEALASYIDRDSGIGEKDVDEKLGKFANVISNVSLKQGSVDTDTIRFAFDHLTETMNEVASERFGYEPPEISFQAVLGWFGVGRQPRRYVRPLDDRYWSKQFMEQYESGENPMIEERGIETEEEYLARYVHGCMKGFLFAPFTLSVG